MSTQLDQATADIAAILPLLEAAARDGLEGGSGVFVSLTCEADEFWSMSDGVEYFARLEVLSMGQARRFYFSADNFYVLLQNLAYGRWDTSA